MSEKINFIPEDDLSLLENQSAETKYITKENFILLCITKFGGIESDNSDIDTIISWMSKYYLHPHSLKYIAQILRSNPLLKITDMKSILSDHIRLGKLFIEAKRLGKIYTDPKYNLGIQDIISGVILEFSGSENKSDFISETWRTLSAYGNFYKPYRLYLGQKPGFSQSFIATAEEWLDAMLNGEEGMDANVVLEFGKMLEVEMKKNQEKGVEDKKSTIIEKDEKPEGYTPLQIINAFFYHPEFPAIIKKSDTLGDILTGLFGKGEDRFRAKLFFVDYREVINMLVGICNDSQSDKKAVVELIEKNIIPGSQRSAEVLKVLYKGGILSQEKCLSILEGKKGFQRGGINLNAFIDMFGLPKSVISGTEIIIGSELSKKQKGNLKKMIQYFLYVESGGGYNIYNERGESSAEAYMQVLKKNAKYRVAGTKTYKSWKSGIKVSSNNLNRDWKRSSFDIFLHYLPEKILTMFPALEKEKRKTGNPGIQSVLKLKAPDQLILTLANLYRRDRRRFMQALNGNTEDAVYLYAKIHHTNPDKATRRLMGEAKEKIYGIKRKMFEWKGKTLIAKIPRGATPGRFLTVLIQKFDKGTSIIPRNSSLSLAKIHFSFPANGEIAISKNGNGYVLNLNGKAFLRSDMYGNFRKV